MNDEIPNDMLEWYRMRKKGMLHFVFLVGGIWFFVSGMMIGVLMLSGLKGPRGVPVDGPTSKGFVVVLAVWLTSCVAIGFLGWFIKEARFRKYREVFAELDQMQESPPSAVKRSL